MKSKCSLEDTQITYLPNTALHSTKLFDMAQPGKTVNSIAEMLNLLEPLEGGEEECLAGFSESDKETGSVCKSVGMSNSSEAKGPSSMEEGELFGQAAFMNDFVSSREAHVESHLVGALSSNDQPMPGALRTTALALVTFDFFSQS